MLKISAHYIFPVTSPPIKNGIVVINNKTEIDDLFDNPEQKEFSNMEFYSGVIVPSFINASLNLLNKNFRIICPNEKKHRADIELFNSGKYTIALHTSENRISDNRGIWEVIKKIMARFPDIPFNDILTWATINGAKANNIESKFGSIEKGKQPGLVLIKNFDFIKFAPSKNSTIKELM